MNHTASTHRWAMAAKAGDPWFQAYYHLYDDRTIPDQYEQTVPQVFPNTAPGNFTWCEEMHKWVLTTFHDYQWGPELCQPGGVRGHDQEHSAPRQPWRGGVPH